MLFEKNRAGGVSCVSELTYAVSGLVAVVLVGCSDDDPVTTVYEDRGKVCVESESDGAVRVQVEFPTCMSSSCDQAKERTCSVELAGDRLIVASRGVVESRGTTCTTDCGILTAECKSEPVEAGMYVIVHGEHSANVTLPTGATPVLGEETPLEGCD